MVVTNFFGTACINVDFGFCISFYLLLSLHNIEIILHITDSKPFKESKPADVLGTFIPPTSEQISTAKNSSLASRNGNITLTSAAEGKSYQTSVHFEVCTVMLHIYRRIKGM